MQIFQKFSNKTFILTTLLTNLHFYKIIKKCQNINKYLVFEVDIPIINNHTQEFIFKFSRFSFNINFS